jgi:RNA polymerase sigma factor (sigma-70 family)
VDPRHLEDVGINSVRRPGESDAAIVERSIADPQAFAALFDRHFDQIYGYLNRRVGHDRADDLAATTFTVAFERRATFRGQDSVRSWLFAIATNLLRNEWRAQKRATSALAQLAATAGSVDVGEGADRAEVLEALARLDPDQRDVVLLHAWDGLSYEEIAAVLEVPIGTVRSRLARARQRLREMLSDEPEDVRQGEMNQ